MERQLAPEWETSTWLNTSSSLALEELRGRVILLHAFQMLCPGCVSRAIPQAQRAVELFENEPLTVVGLHTVFEHHDAMQELSLRAFLHEYRVRYPVGIDKPGQHGEPIPRTMHAYRMRGTPTTILIDSQGYIRQSVFGAYDDLRLGADIGALLAEVRGTGVRNEGPDDSTRGTERVAGQCSVS
ncbi:MAG: redoxin domain-containing protein [Proteobacteria bacterium]|nr:redoxin domain-containing protein [Pseudomonadota bacterium]